MYAAARQEIAHHRGRPGLRRGHHVPQETVHDVLLKNTEVPVFEHVHFEALQLQAQLIVLLIDENRKLDTLLAASLQVSTLESKNAISKKKAQRAEHEQFMKGWGEAKSKKNVLTKFP